MYPNKCHICYIVLHVLVQTWRVMRTGLCGFGSGATQRPCYSYEHPAPSPRSPRSSSTPMATRLVLHLQQHCNFGDNLCFLYFVVTCKYFSVVVISCTNIDLNTLYAFRRVWVTLRVTFVCGRSDLAPATTNPSRCSHNHYCSVFRGTTASSVVIGYYIVTS